MSGQTYQSLDEEWAARTAFILGDSSAAALALRELKSRRENGEQAHIINHFGAWIVVNLPCPYCQSPAHNESTEPCPKRREDAEKFAEAGKETYPEI